jgi:hypothetical protein
VPAEGLRSWGRGTGGGGGQPRHVLRQRLRRPSAAMPGPGPSSTHSVEAARAHARAGCWAGEGPLWRPCHLQEPYPRDLVICSAAARQMPVSLRAPSTQQPAASGRRKQAAAARAFLFVPRPRGETHSEAHLGRASRLPGPACCSSRARAAAAARGRSSPRKCLLQFSIAPWLAAAASCVPGHRSSSMRRSRCRRLHCWGHSAANGARQGNSRASSGSAGERSAVKEKQCFVTFLHGPRAPHARTRLLCR